MKGILPILPKIGYHRNVLEESVKLARIDNIHANTFHLVYKNRENRSSKSWDSFAQFKKKKRKVKYIIARSAT